MSSGARSSACWRQATEKGRSMLALSAQSSRTSSQQGFAADAGLGPSERIAEPGGSDPRCRCRRGCPRAPGRAPAGDRRRRTGGRCWRCRPSRRARAPSTAWLRRPWSRRARGSRTPQTGERPRKPRAGPQMTRASRTRWTPVVWSTSYHRFRPFPGFLGAEHGSECPRDRSRGGHTAITRPVRVARQRREWPGKGPDYLLRCQAQSFTRTTVPAPGPNTAPVTNRSPSRARLGDGPRILGALEIRGADRRMTA